jgi:biotin carboxyl carrier protein
MKYVTTVGDDSSTHKYVIDINSDGEVTIDNEPRRLDLQEIDDDGLYSLLIDHKSFEALVEEGDGHYRVLINGTLYQVQVADERAKRLAEAASAFAPTSGDLNIKSPMPGLIVAIPVQQGDAVKKGQVVLVLESMKMENELKAPRDGTISAIKIQPRQAVEQGQVLLTIS